MPRGCLQSVDHFQVDHVAKSRVSRRRYPIAAACSREHGAISSDLPQELRSSMGVISPPQYFHFIHATQAQANPACHGDLGLHIGSFLLESALRLRQWAAELLCGPECTGERGASRIQRRFPRAPPGNNVTGRVQAGEGGLQTVYLAACSFGTNTSSITNLAVIEVTQDLGLALMPARSGLSRPFENKARSRYRRFLPQTTNTSGAGAIG